MAELSSNLTPSPHAAAAALVNAGENNTLSPRAAAPNAERLPPAAPRAAVAATAAAKCQCGIKQMTCKVCQLGWGQLHRSGRSVYEFAEVPTPTKEDVAEEAFDEIPVAPALAAGLQHHDANTLAPRAPAPALAQPQANASQESPPTPEAAPLMDDSFGISFEGAGRHDTSQIEDAVCAVLEELKNVMTVQEFRRVIWPRDLFRGCGTDEKVYQYVLRSLTAIHEDTRTHRDIAQDGSFVTAHIVPKPLHTAAVQIALKHGIHLETLLLALASNITWLEHNLTRLGVDTPKRGCERDRAVCWRESIRSCAGGSSYTFRCASLSTGVDK